MPTLFRFMRSRNIESKKKRSRSLGAERLEGRCMMSGISTLAPGPATADSVQGSTEAIVGQSHNVSFGQSTYSDQICNPTGFEEDTSQALIVASRRVERGDPYIQVFGSSAGRADVGQFSATARSSLNAISTLTSNQSGVYVLREYLSSFVANVDVNGQSPSELQHNRTYDATGTIRMMQSTTSLSSLSSYRSYGVVSNLQKVDSGAGTSGEQVSTYRITGSFTSTGSRTISKRHGVRSFSVTFENEGRFWRFVEARFYSSSQVPQKACDVQKGPTVTGAHFSVDEGTPPTSTLGHVEIEERHRAPFTFGLVNASESPVNVNATTGEVTLKPGVELDFESRQKYEIPIFVRDFNGAETLASLIVNVRDVDEPPRFRDGVSVPSAVAGERYEWRIPDDLVVDVDGDDWTLNVYDSSGSILSSLSFDPSNRILSGMFSSWHVGVHELILEAAQVDANDLSSSRTYSLSVLGKDLPLQNGVNRYDVNADDQVSALDALQVINLIAINGPLLSVDSSVRLDGFFDTNGDNAVTAIDALLVVNILAQQSTADFENAATNFDGLKRPELALLDDYYAMRGADPLLF